MAAVVLLGPEPGDLVLDLCAAPGGKSTQIAGRLGFQSPHYFSRRFRQATGMSPSEYERSVKMLSELSGVYPDDRTNNV